MIVNIKNHHFVSVSSAGTITNTDFAQCRNTKAASAETVCSLSSTLRHVKSIKDVFITSNNGQDKFRIDIDFLVPASLLSLGKSRIIHLEAEGKLNSNSVDYFESVTITSANKVEAMIPPSSCFNLTLVESISTIDISFDTGVLQGTISANLIGLASTEVIPCI